MVLDTPISELGRGVLLCGCSPVASIAPTYYTDKDKKPCTHLLLCRPCDSYFESETGVDCPTCGGKLEVAGFEGEVQ